MRNRWWAAPVLAGAAVVITACGSSSPSTTAPKAPASTSTAPASSSSNSSGSVMVSTRSTSIGTVLVNAQGHTLYWFAIDTPTKSNCNGTCASYWPPVMGKAVAASGTTLPKGFSTITRSDGSTQATYDGHPLYTYAADTAPGMTSGNDKNLSGGLWWAMTPTGAKPSSGGSAPSPTSTGGGGY
jgi:predicted lipoprotein with Yx(FWY)xxD motif